MLYVRIASRDAPPSSSYSGRPLACPQMSQRAMSIADAERTSAPLDELPVYERNAVA